jgi:hypothetical protein
MSVQQERKRALSSAVRDVSGRATRTKRCRRILRIATVLMTLGILALPRPFATVKAATPPWVEPRALSIVDMAGQVPDAALAGHVISHANPGGLARFEASSWVGNKLRIQVRAFPRFRWSPAEGGWVTDGPLLGHRPVLDHMSASVPEASLRVYADGVDITDQVVYYGYMRPTLTLPVSGPGDPRYDTGNVIAEPPRPIPPDGMPIPANWGGSFTIRAVHPTLTLVWTLTPTARPTIRYVGEESFSYPSYIGPGYTGWFEPLMRQMRARYADRHPRFMLRVPPEANYVLFVYEPQPYDLDTGYWARDHALYAQNKGQPVAGTVRLSPGEGMLSQDLTHGGAFPLDVWWQDADQSAGPYLSVFTSSTRPIDRMTPPEFVVLPGTPYHACFEDGNCPASVLQDIYDRRATIKVVYLQVDPIYTGVQAIPLRMVASNWHPGLATSSDIWGSPAMSAPALRWPVRTLLPLVLTPHAHRPPLPTERPLGFFDPASGRMVGYLAE